MSSNLRTVALVSQTFAGCAFPKRVEERSSGRRRKEERGDRETRESAILNSRKARGVAVLSLLTNLRRRDQRGPCRLYKFNNTKWRDLRERPRPHLWGAPRTHQYCKALASARSFACHPCRSRASKMSLVKLILRFHDHRKRQEKIGLPRV